MTIAAETTKLIRAAIDGDPDLDTLVVTGSTPATLAATILPGAPSKVIGGSTYNPAPPFRRETLVELVVRMQRLRWQKALSFMPLPPLPQRKDLQALHSKHLRATVPFECGPGWTALLDATFSWLHEIAPDHQWSASQIKEKYASLRFYWHGDLPGLGDEIIEAAEHLSGHLCELCGAPGTLQTQHGWWSTRCPDHKNWSPW